MDGLANINTALKKQVAVYIQQEANFEVKKPTKQFHITWKYIHIVERNEWVLSPGKGNPKAKYL